MKSMALVFSMGLIAACEDGGGRAEGPPLAGDPTGCGDVFGATLASCLLAGTELEPAVATANRMGRRNVTYRGATGLQHHLRGSLPGALAS